MQFEGRRRGSRVPNLTPLVDIVFLLLVFFMLTSHFVQEEQFSVELPRASSGQPPAVSEQVEVVLERDGAIRIGGAIVPPESLVEVLRARLAAVETPVVRIRGDQASALGQTVKVLEAAQQAGAQGVDIVTRTP